MCDPVNEIKCIHCGAVNRYVKLIAEDSKCVGCGKLVLTKDPGLTKELVAQVKLRIDRGYHDRTDYPPFALDPITDRGRYREYIFRVLDDMVE